MAVALLLGGAGPTAAETVTLSGAAPSLRARIDPGIPVDPPAVRIGLGGLRDKVSVGVTGGTLAVLDGHDGREAWPGHRAGDLLVVPAGGRVAGRRVDYRVQVGSFRAEPAAQDLARRLEAEFGVPAEAVWQPARGVWRVWVGRQPRRQDLEDVLARLRAGGYKDAWVVEQELELRADVHLGLLDRTWAMHPTRSESLVFIARGGGLLTVDGRPYRGMIEVVSTPQGRLRVINEINLELYLRGVVPEELGPAVWPEPEALKAQAVAARTYVLANLGQYAAEGYDICDTPRCQVYGGAASEHPMTDRAVRETAGRILVYQGRPINAMYTSTCGGHTEDVEAVFPDLVGPYLKGVPTVPSPRTLRRLVMPVEGPALPALASAAEHGGGDSLGLVRLVAAQVVPPQVLDPAFRAAPVTAAEFDSWLAGLAQRAGRPAPAALDSPPTRLEAWRRLCAVVACAPGRGELAPGDERWVLGGVTGLEALAAEDRASVAELVVRELIHPGPGGRFDPRGRVTRGEALAWIVALAERYQVAPLARGSVRRLQRGRLVIRQRRSARAWSLDPRPYLLARTGGRWHLAERVELLPGDRVRFVGDARGRLLVLAVEARKSASDDRFSRRYRWEKSRSREELEKTLGKVAPVGRLLDLRILARGVSGRVAMIEVEGTGGTAQVEGFRIRRALDLPETLFSLEVQHDADGSLRRAIFSGRGWGHGVGLCQVGAYGMAMRGRDWREILHHYYHDVKIVRARIRSR
ncbi:MAG: SpoIID/LytB domain-containing protein [Acidobacteriota bacterium]|nr:SpoIID/LytB domain-containing protein [Acidobacteriota bacterium]MDQ7088259.1 SpoIID/LytB domain-containing protein [Acidobacteriota bacterium]